MTWNRATRRKNPKVRRIKLPHSHTPVFWELAQYPRMVAILEKTAGPVRRAAAKLEDQSEKRRITGSPVEWHQDWAFYPHTNDDMLAVGVMLDDAFLGEWPAAGGARLAQGTDLGSSFGGLFLRRHGSHPQGGRF